ncbi:MAG: hypothetical protein HYZ14_18150 [Bacteroidetes bacterium]|nr:hypothetical protein [Bacteroidota bacterium]
MKKILLLPIFLSTFSGHAQSLDFGLEVQQNTNLVQKWVLTNELNELNRAFSLQDANGDTMNVYFTTFSMTNNFEIPVYFRFNFKRRWFADFKLSNASHTLIMEGVANFNKSFFTSNYGTYADFVTQAQANGFNSVDTSDYINYINGAAALYQTSVRSKEEFKVLAMTANFGLRLMPHRSIRPYITAGLTLKSKYRKFSYQHLEFTNPNIYDYHKVNQGVNKFAENTLYLNMGFGLEFYRFRAGLYYQAGFSFQPTNGITNDVVIDVNPYTSFQRIHSYGFTICTNLFSAPVGKRVIYDDLSADEMVLSNIQKKQYKWDFGLRFNRRGFNDVSTFYTNNENRLSVMSRDSILYNNGSVIQSAEKVEMLTFGDVKRILWSGQLDFVFTRNFGKRFSLEFLVGSSSLTTDIETTEFTATVLHDTAANSYLYTNSEPRIQSGVYRNTFNLTNFSIAAGFKIIDRDLFSLKIFAGTGYTVMVHRSLSFIDLPDGVNGLTIYKTIDQNYYALEDNSLYANQGTLNVTLDDSPDALFTQFGNTRLDSNWPTPERQRKKFPMVRIGFEAAIDRFTLGLSVDRSANYMDGFLLNQYSSVYFSIGYKLIRH